MRGFPPCPREGTVLQLPAHPVRRLPTTSSASCSPIRRDPSNHGNPTAGGRAQPGPPQPAPLPQPLPPGEQAHPGRPCLTAEMPQAPRRETSQERDGPTPRQTLPADSTGMDAATPQPPARPTPSAFWNHHHLGRAGDPAPYTLRHVARHGQDKEAEQDQDMQTTLGPLNHSAFCVTMHRSQPRVERDGVHCTPFRGLAQIHYGQRQAPFSAPLRSPEAHFSDLDVPNLRRSLLGQPRAFQGSNVTLPQVTRCPATAITW